jgi:phthalate 4,5-cis-dihydrodiol dehydrogenase
MGKVRVGFVGCGKHATNDLYPNLCRIPNMEFIATCDLKEDLARRNATIFGAKRYYNEISKMLENEQLDAVIIVGPPQMHEEVGIECLNRGHHIFVEKPSSITIEGSKKLAEAADRANKFGQIGHMMRHSPPLELAKRITSSEGFGKPIYLESKYFTSGPREPRRFWGLQDLEWTYMFVQGLHPIDLAHFFMGDMKNVIAKIASGKDGRLAFAVSVEFTNGGVGSLNFTSSFPGWETRIEVSGDSGALVEVTNMSRLRYSEAKCWSKDLNFKEPILSKTWDVSPYDQGERIGYRGELTHFIECVASNSIPKPNLWDGYRAMVICKAILESSEEGRVIPIRY